MPPRFPRAAADRISNRIDDLTEYLRQETTGGELLLAATAIALIWANVAGGSYEGFWDTKLTLGPEWLHLDLTLAKWAADGLLAIFFFVAGIEVKRELVVGELAGLRAAALPLAAAIGGMVLPAVVAIVVSGGAAARGGAWAIPVATDIAFALGVLAIARAALPSGVRVLLLSMAVIDDLGAITLVAVLFTADLKILWLLAGLAGCALYALAHRRDWVNRWFLLAIAAAVWTCIHASGVHATVAGILLGLLTPVHKRPGERRSRGERYEHRLHPISAGIAVPIFALAAAGIPLGAIGDAVRDPIAYGIVAGLLIGKVAGVMGGAYLAVRLRIGELPSGVAWADVAPVAVLAAIGYTVSLLISGLAFDEPAAQGVAAAAVLFASVLASVLAVVLLRSRSAARAEAAASAR